MSLDYGLGTMTATTLYQQKCTNSFCVEFYETVMSTLLIYISMEVSNLQASDLK